MNSRTFPKLATLTFVLLLLPLTLLACGSSENSSPSATQVSERPNASLTSPDSIPATLNLTSTPSGTPLAGPPVIATPPAQSAGGSESSTLPGSGPTLSPASSPQSEGSNPIATAAIPVIPPTQPLPAEAYPAGPDTLYVGETGHFIKSQFLAYWQKYGGASVFGNPLSESYLQNGIQVQLFEQALLEYHPEKGGQPAEIQLGFLGRQLAEAQALLTTSPAFTPVPASPDTPAESYFPQTSHTLAGAFKAFWETNGLLKFLGYPISQSMEQNGLLVQYFERGRLEYDAAVKKVNYSNSGDLLIAAAGWPQPQKFELNLNAPENTISQGQVLSIKLSSPNQTSGGGQPAKLQGKFGPYSLKFTQGRPDPSGDVVFKALQAIEPSLEPQTYLLVLNFLDKQEVARTIIRSLKVTAHDYGTQDLSLTGDLAALADHSADEYDDAQLAAVYNTFTPVALWQGEWQWPLRVVWTQVTDFAQRRTYNGKLDTLYYHDGIDMAPNSGTSGDNVRVGAAGKVIYTGSLEARGLSVAVDHGLGVTSYYFHLSQIEVKVGQTLQSGEVVGLVGSTGRSTGPHLHWEVRVNGLIADPRNFLEADLSK